MPWPVRTLAWMSPLPFVVRTIVALSGSGMWFMLESLPRSVRVRAPFEGRTAALWNFLHNPVTHGCRPPIADSYRLCLEREFRA